MVLEEDTELVGSSRLNDLDNAVMHIRLNGCLCKDALSKRKAWANFSSWASTTRWYCDLHWFNPRRWVQSRPKSHNMCLTGRGLAGLPNSYSEVPNLMRWENEGARVNHRWAQIK